MRAPFAFRDFFMCIDKKIIVQGYPGCFHEEAAQKYFQTEDTSIVPSDSFDMLADILDANQDDHIAIMAIENSIAGSIIQNYRILREREFRVVGEVYLRIKHNLMALPGIEIDQLKQVSSHPMAINQCLNFFNQHPHIKLVKSEDTALSAKHVADRQKPTRGAIASKVAAKIYGLNILAESIETSKINYTRFFILNGKHQVVPQGKFDKASIYLRVLDKPGCLLKAMDKIAEHNINISKLQSYPVLGKVNEYYFYLDLEFAEMGQYEAVMEYLPQVTLELKELGTYKKASVYDHQTIA